MKKIIITIEDLFDLPTSVIYNPDAYKSASRVIIDSRKIQKGDLFVAIKGLKLDGHDFVFEAIKNGACAILINSNRLKKFNSLKIPIVTVKNTTPAYGKLANHWRNKLNAKVISITGSNGKTTTKEMIASLLNSKFVVTKSEANNNNHIGVPLTILSADEKCEALILEQGTNHFGEISYSARISEPDIALITNIGDSHLEFLKNRKGVYKEKSALFDETQKNNGVLLINTDDPILRKETKKYKNRITFGFLGKPQIKGKLVATIEGKPKIEISYKGNSFSTTLPVYGKSNAKNFLAASAAALMFGMNGKEIVNAAKNIANVKGRLEVKNYSKAVLINDTYNSSPISVQAAYELVNDIKKFKQKIVVLGDMFELGKQSVKLHKGLSEIFKNNKNLFVLTIGNLMPHLTTELRKRNIKSIHFHLREALALYLKYEEIDNSVILVKGSRGMMMEEFVNILKTRFE